jgi:hypothetical protein
MSADIRPAPAIPNTAQAVVEARNVAFTRPLIRGETDQMIQAEAVAASGEARDLDKTDDGRGRKQGAEADQKVEPDDQRDKNKRRQYPHSVVKIDSDTLRAYLEILDPATGKPIQYLPTTYRQRDPEKRDKDIVVGGDPTLDITA